MSRINLFENNFQHNVNKIQRRCWILISEGGEENSSIIGGWGGQLWEAQVLGVLYGATAECDLAKTQNSWVNNEEEELVYVCKNENQC